MQLQPRTQCFQPAAAGPLIGFIEFLDHPLDTALRVMGEWPLFPVVHRANLQELLGVVSLDDVMRAHRGAGIGETGAESEMIAP